MMLDLPKGSMPDTQFFIVLSGIIVKGGLKI